MRKQKGITLIALVITIIVLLIITSITLGLLLGENGIVNKSRRAVIDHEIGREKEEISLAFNAVKIEKLGKGDSSYVTFVELQDQMDQENGDGIAEVGVGEEEEILEVTFTKSERTYEIDQNGNIKIKNNDEDDDEDLPVDVEIYAIEDLIDLSKAVSNGETYEGKVIGLMRTLDFQDYNSYRNPGSTEYGDLNGNGTTEALISEVNNGGYNPIGLYNEDQPSESKPFKGIFDGKNNSIKHMYVVNKVNVGFFGHIEDATIKNFNIEKIIILNGSKNIGTIAAYTSGNSKIKNCSAINENNSIGGANNVGGLVGLTKGIISVKKSKFETTASIRGEETTGGIIGKVEGNVTIENTSTLIKNYISSGGTLGGAIGEVNGSAKVKSFSNEATLNGNKIIAGVIGKVTGLTDEDKVYIYETNNKGTMSGSETSGIIGSIENIKQVTLQKCYNTAEIRNGGIIGTISGKSTINAINNCYNEGNIYQYGSSKYTSGIIGSADGITIKAIANSYNTGNLIAGKRTGGIIGSADNTNIEKIYKCYNEGQILSSGESAGGICGYSNGSINIDDCYNKATAQLSYAHISGIIGYIGKDSSNVQINNSHNEGKFEIYSGNAAGIIAKVDYDAKNVKISINNTYNSAPITSNYYAGGIIGSIDEASEVKLNNCNNTAQIQSNSYAGGIISNISANNLEIANTYNTGTIISSSDTIAGITAKNKINGTVLIDNCYNKGKITDNSQYGASNIAGIIGYMQGDYNKANDIKVIVKNSYNEGEFEYSKAKGRIAGVIGTTEYLTIELISNCYNTANIEKDNTNQKQVYIGGILGYQSGRVYKIEKCYNTGNIKNGNYAGGIVAYTAYTNNEENNIVVEECYNTGAITESYSVGGIIGYYYNSSNQAKLQMKKCHNTAEVKGIINSAASSNTNLLSTAAGIIGTANVNSIEMELNECYNEGNISSSEYSGGIIGEIYGTPKKTKIYKCFNEGTIKRENLGYGSGHGFSAGIIPYAGTGNLEIDSCYNIGKILSFADYAQVGGIVGSISGKNSIIRNSYNTGEIELPYGGRDAGGIVSYTINTNITNCYNTGNIKIGASSEEKPEIQVPSISYGSSGLLSIGSGIWSGGIVGYATETKVEDCYNTGNIICEAEALNSDGTEDPGRILIGGLIGALYSNNGDSYVKRCYNTAQITIQAQKQYVAGVIGFYHWWSCDEPEAVYYTDSNYKFASNDYNNMNTTEGRLKTIEELKKDDILNSLNNGRNNWKKGTNGLPTINM